MRLLWEAFIFLSMHALHMEQVLDKYMSQRNSLAKAVKHEEDEEEDLVHDDSLLL